MGGTIEETEGCYVQKNGTISGEIRDESLIFSVER